MDDSGFDSGVDKFLDEQQINQVQEESLRSTNFDIIFNVNRNDCKISNNIEHIKINTNNNIDKTNEVLEKSINVNTCKTLQRKLELKVEKAKQNFNQHNNIDGQETKMKSTNLIPINRLHIPGYQERLPLIEYKHENSDDEEISFFPKKNKLNVNHELSDTFSIQEMTIESDSDEIDSPNLDLLLPLPNVYC